jgi:hypothetical protein
MNSNDKKEEGTKMKKCMSIILAFSLLPFFVSCTTSKDIPAEIINKPTTFSQEYPNLPEGIYSIRKKIPSLLIKIIAKFSKDISKVIVVDKEGKSEESVVKPDGKYWIDYSEGIDTPVNIHSIIGIPKDGSEKITYQKFTLNYVSYNCKINFDPHEAGEQEVRIDDGSLKTIKAFMDINGKLLEMKKDEKGIFKLMATLPQSPCAKLYLFDKNNEVIEIIDLKMALFKEHRKYYCPIWDYYQENTICSTDINGADFRIEYFIKTPKPKLEEEEEYEGFEFGQNSSNAVQLISLSKDARYFFLTSSWDRRSDLGSLSPIFVNGRRVSNTKLTDYLVFDSQDRSYHSIVRHYRYELYPMDDRGPALIEKGNLVLPVKWYEDKVVCSFVSKIGKEVKDGETKTGVINFETGVEDAFSPFATAKGIEVDLSTYEYKDSQEFKPLSPFMSFADDSTGVIGYVDIFEKPESDGGEMQYMATFNQEFRYVTNYFTDYSQKNVYKMSDLVKRVLPKKYDKHYELSYRGSRIENNRIKAFFLFNADNKEPLPPGDESQVTQYWSEFDSERYFLFFSLDLESGKIEKIVENEKKKNSHWEYGTPSFLFVILGSGDLPTNTWVSSFRGRWVESDLYGFVLKEYDGKVPKVLKDNKLMENPSREKPFFEGYIR